MREVLFRGKNKYIKSGWCFGYYYEKNDTKRIRNDYQDLEIDIKTLGQYTGLKDKNGTKIFEGDVVKWKFINDNTEITATIVFYNGGFCLYGTDSIEMCYPSLKICDMWSYEVIGNIYDNPELVNGE